MALKLPEYVTEEDFVKIMKATKKPHHKLVWVLAFRSGLRIQEILNLKPEDVKFNEKKIEIRQGKGSKDRVAILPKGFPQENIKYLPIKCSKRALQFSFKAIVKRAGITKNLHIHSLRHGFAVVSMNKGIPLNVLQQALGHSNIATTSIYTKINPKDMLNKYEELW